MEKATWKTRAEILEEEIFCRFRGSGGNHQSFFDFQTVFTMINMSNCYRNHYLVQWERICGKWHSYERNHFRFSRARIQALKSLFCCAIIITMLIEEAPRTHWDKKLRITACYLVFFLHLNSSQVQSQSPSLQCISITGGTEECSKRKTSSWLQL